MPRYIPYLTKISDLKSIIPTASIDLGNLICSELILELMKAIEKLKSGDILKVHALDPDAPIDIAAWCAIQNHELVAGPCGKDNAYYFIKKGK